MFSLGLMVLGAGLVSSQDYPNKPIRIVTADPGGASDFAARLIAPGLSDSLGEQVVVDNRGGAGGAIAANIVAKAPPDGYTLLYYGSSIWILPLLHKVAFDPLRDFSPVTAAVRSPNVLVVHPSLPIKSVKELIALGKARPGELNYGSGGSGTASHLAPELFKAMAGVNIVRIIYRGAGPALNALLSGELHVMFPAAPAAMPHVKSGRLRALAVSSAQPSALTPDLPTVAASGLPGYEAVSIYGIFAPTGTPATVINRLNQEVVRVLNRTDVKNRFFNMGVEVAATSPEEFAATISSEMARMGKVIKDAGIRAD